MAKHLNIVTLLVCHSMKNENFSWGLHHFVAVMVGGMFWTHFCGVRSSFHGPGKFTRWPGSCSTKGWWGTFSYYLPLPHHPQHTLVYQSQCLFNIKHLPLGGFCDGIKGWQGIVNVALSLPCHLRVNIRTASLVAALVGGIFWIHSLTFFCAVRFFTFMDLGGLPGDCHLIGNISLWGMCCGRARSLLHCSPWIHAFPCTLGVICQMRES